VISIQEFLVNTLVDDKVIYHSIRKVQTVRTFVIEFVELISEMVMTAI